MGHPVGCLQIHGSKRQSTTHECYFIIDFSFCARVSDRSAARDDLQLKTPQQIKLLGEISALHLISFQTKKY